MTRRPRTLAPLALLVVVGGLLLAAQALGLRFNHTASLPVGLYRLVDRPFELGDLVAACPPVEAVRLGVERGYLPAGQCLGGGAPVLKQVVGKGGQVVAIRSDGVWIDGERVQGPAPTRDSKDRLLDLWPAGDYVLALDQLWLAAPSPRSFDSRYYGPIDRGAVLGVVLPVWTGEAP